MIDIYPWEHPGSEMEAFPWITRVEKRPKQCDFQPKGVYHLTGNTSVSPYDLAQKIAKTFNLKADIKKGSFKEYLKKDPRPRQQYSKISNKKVEKDFEKLKRQSD